MRTLIMIATFTLFMVAMDLYTMRGIRTLELFSVEGNRLFNIVYWSVSGVMFMALLWAGISFQQLRDPSRFFGVMLIMGIFLMLYVPKLFFNVTQLLGDLTGLIARLANPGANLTLLKRYFLLPGLGVGVLLVIAFAYGMIRGRTHLKVVEETVQIASLPDSFRELRLVQLSDFHLAGFHNNPAYVKEVIRRVNQLEPDLILFTGDMVHNFSEELDPFTEKLNELEARLGKFAVLGNHDYGHYYDWESTAAEEANLDRVKSQIRAAGFDLLLNEHRIVSLNGDSLVLVGVENWGKPPFPQEGDLATALEGTDPAMVRILLSHDPSHWDLQVRGKEEIELTLSGHTHGMQFGIEIGDFRWSPSRWTYKQWAGLYSENGQHLYVNRGLGYTGFPGRVGIRPEITLITLSAD